MAAPPHFILIPLFAQGHMIPMIDMARLIANQDATVTLVTTPNNASRFSSIISRARGSGLSIRLLQIPFPCQEVGLPLGYENLDTLPTKNLLPNFYSALALLQEPLERILDKQDPPPSCIISDRCISWTSMTAQRLKIPHLVFHGMCCFSLLSAHNIRTRKAHLTVSSDTEPFWVPGMPKGYSIKRSQLPGSFISLPDLDDVRNKMQEAESSAYGIVVNSFDELEHGCSGEYQRAESKKVWCIGPVSLCNKENLDKFERGNKATIQNDKCIEWLDSMKPRSVIYACLGSLCRLVPPQLIELGLGLEYSQKPFIWVIKTEDKGSELEEWLDKEKFEERVKGRGLLIKGWAPQVMILSHEAIGGFLTHCGWNSTIEGICSGVPLITWPQFSEQFLNEKLVVEILRIGVPVGVEVPVRWGDEEKVGVVVKRNEVVKAVKMLMDGGEESEMRRERVIELGEMAKKAMNFGGSSNLNLVSLIRDIIKQQPKEI